MAPKTLTAFRLDAELVDTLDQTARRLSLQSGDLCGPMWSRTDVLRYLVRQALDQLEAGRGDDPSSTLPRRKRSSAADWVKSKDEKRAEALVPKVAKLPGPKATGTVTRGDVLRLALLRGLDELEQETGKGAKPTPSPARAASGEPWRLDSLLPEEDDILARGLDEAAAQLGDEPGGKGTTWDRAKAMRYLVWQGLARMGITYDSLTARRKKGSALAATRRARKRRR